MRQFSKIELSTYNPVQFPPQSGLTVNGAHLTSETTVAISGALWQICPTSAYISINGTQYRVLNAAVDGSEITLETGLIEDLSGGEDVINVFFDVSNWVISCSGVRATMDFQAAKPILHHPVQLTFGNQKRTFYDRQTKSIAWDVLQPYMTTWCSQQATDIQYIVISIKKTAASDWEFLYVGKIVPTECKAIEHSRLFEIETESPMFTLKDTRMMDVPGIFELHPWNSTTRKQKHINGFLLAILVRCIAITGLQQRSYTVTYKERTANICTIRTSVNHGAKQHEAVIINIGDRDFDGTWICDTAVDDEITFRTSRVGEDIAGSSISVSDGLTTTHQLYESNDVLFNRTINNWVYNFHDQFFNSPVWVDQTVQAMNVWAFLVKCMGVVRSLDFTFDNNVLYAHYRSKNYQPPELATLPARAFKETYVQNPVWEFSETNEVIVRADYKHYGNTITEKTSRKDLQISLTFEDFFPYSVKGGYRTGDNRIIIPSLEAVFDVGEFFQFSNHDNLYKVEEYSAPYTIFSPSLTEDVPAGTRVMAVQKNNVFDLAFSESIVIKLKYASFAVQSLSRSFGENQLYLYVNTGGDLVDYERKYPGVITNANGSVGCCVLPFVPGHYLWNIPASMGILSTVNGKYATSGKDANRFILQLFNWAEAVTGNSIYDSGNTNMGSRDIHAAFMYFKKRESTDKTEAKFIVIVGCKDWDQDDDGRCVPIQRLIGTFAQNDKGGLSIEFEDPESAKYLLSNPLSLNDNCNCDGVFINADPLNPSYDKMIYASLGSRHDDDTSVASIIGTAVTDLIKITSEFKDGDTGFEKMFTGSPTTLSFFKGMFVHAGDTTNGQYFYFVDAYNKRICKCYGSSWANLTYIAGSSGGGATSPSKGNYEMANNLALNQPRSVVVDYEGRVYYTDQKARKIFVQDLDNKVWCIDDATGLNEPMQIALVEFERCPSKDDPIYAKHEAKEAWTFYGAPNSDKRKIVSKFRYTGLGNKSFSMLDRIKVATDVMAPETGANQYLKMIDYHIDVINLMLTIQWLEQSPDQNEGIGYWAIEDDFVVS